MKTLSVGEFKTNFSEVLKEVENGEKIAIAYGKKKEIKALLVPNEPKKAKRKLGILQGKASYRIKKGYRITEEEFLGL